MKPPVKFTRIRCSNCDADAPASVVVSERRKLVADLAAKGWKLTTGEAECPTCAGTFEALSATKGAA